jgi:hypothetical protein
MKLTIKKILIFIKSLIFHIYWGFPKSTQEQINYRFSICNNCEFFDKEYSQCMECGCNINNKKIFMNKLAWADQQCPLNKWQKIK